MRLFIAINVPDNIKEHFLFLQDKIKVDAKINLVKTFHLTLKFLGDVPEEKVEQIKKLLSTISFDSFTAKLNGAGVFPNEKRIRVFWIGIEPQDKIIALQKSIDNALKDLFEPDTRFHPHITLGRVKFVKDKKALVEQVNSLPIEPLEFPIESVSLIKSTLTKQGPIYEVIESFPSKTL